VGGAFAQLTLAVGGKALVLGPPQVAQPADRPLDQTGQVTLDVRGVLAGQFDLAGEAEVVVG
jgi:hypothetical protein